MVSLMMRCCTLVPTLSIACSLWFYGVLQTTRVPPLGDWQLNGGSRVNGVRACCVLSMKHCVELLFRFVKFELFCPTSAQFLRFYDDFQFSYFVCLFSHVLLPKQGFTFSLARKSQTRSRRGNNTVASGSQTLNYSGNDGSCNDFFKLRI